MSGLIGVLIWAFIIFFIVRRVIKSGITAGGKTNAAAKSKARKYTNYRPHKDIVSVTRDMGDKNNSVLRDDTNNDWLAKQLREEHRAFKMTSEMFDLKIEHASHCDARLMAQFHRSNCDASGVDLANGSATMNRRIQNQ